MEVLCQQNIIYLRADIRGDEYIIKITIKTGKIELKFTD